MENAIGIRNKSVRAKSVDRPSILGWYHSLRMHYHWTMFQAIRYVLWFSC